ncbi:IPT/TIG domain-containing protein [Jejuia pallidilutea]|uniref:IPT/TIG domain-containing protein n=1 Tax=Jejuia pallidilutea TaxID=504487 RepID=A0A090WQD2_9FLAO|nr:IPT/TIG domain-containing protein [Jejuia pallidilutea]GAL69632.1 hypothetical protein JCM19302_3821 [Jejuia pallidilutea]
MSQSFFRYNLLEDLAATPFSKIQNITETLYADISRFSKVNYVEIDKFDVEHIISKSKSNKTLLPPSSISLDKSEITAGTKEELTITGSGFGNTQGKVEFRNADDGGGTLIAALDSQVVSWNDSQIIVEVPSFAGTGTIRVVDSNGDASPLSSVLTVLYSEANAETDPDGTGLYLYQNSNYSMLIETVVAVLLGKCIQIFSTKQNPILLTHHLTSLLVIKMPS